MVLQAGSDNLKCTIMRLSIVCCFAAALFGSGGLRAQNKSSDTTARYFIIQASIGNLLEIALGRLAAQQAVDPEVKAFAGRMIADHTQAQAQLMGLVKSRGFQIPESALDPPVEDPMLKNLRGKDFDRVYVHMMASSHGQTVQLFESYAITGADPEVKAFAQKVLPVIKEHLASITGIAKNLDSENILTN
jgi:putative membrane protein